jgi:hypothetical protein
MTKRSKGALKAPDKSVDRGRTKGLAKEYEPRFCGVAINQGRQGKSRAQIAVYLGVTRKRLAIWEQAHPEFAEAMEIAADQALAWWESKAQRSLEKKHFQAGMLNKMMASRYPSDYGDKSQLDIGGDALRTITRRIIRPLSDNDDDKRRGRLLNHLTAWPRSTMATMLCHSRRAVVLVCTTRSNSMAIDHVG